MTTWQPFNAYATYDEYMCNHRIWQMPPRKRFAYCFTARKTFEAFQLFSPPLLKAHLSSAVSKRAIQDEIKNFMLARNRICTDDNWYWLLLHGTDFQALYESDHVFKYMLGNISCACPVLLDISEVFFFISDFQLYYYLDFFLIFNFAHRFFTN